MTFKELIILEKEISISNYDLMLHTIGFERNRVHRYKIYPHRNYFAESVSSTDDWDTLERLGVAELMERKDDMVFYKLSDLGIKFVEAREGCKVIFDNSK